MDTDSFVKLKETFSDIGLHNVSSIKNDENALRIFNFIVYSLPGVVAIHGYSDVGFQTVCKELYDQCCACQHVSQLTYFIQVQQSLTNTLLNSWAYQAAAFTYHSITGLNPHDMASATLAAGKNLMWFGFRRRVLMPLFRVSPHVFPSIVDTSTELLLNIAFGSESRSFHEGASLVSSSSESTSTACNDMTRSGTPQMHPR